MTTATVIILSHQPGEWLEACITSVIEQADEVIVVDNGSAAGSVTRVAKPTGVRVLRSEQNLGYAAGVNLGIRSGHGDLVALLNDDAVAGPGWLNDAASALDDELTACVVPKVIRRGWYREIILHDEQDSPTDHRRLGRKLLSVTSRGRELLDKLLGAGVHQLEGKRESPAGLWRWTLPGAPFYAPLEDPSDDTVLINGEPAPTGPVCRLLNKAGGYLLADGVLGDIGDESPDDGRWDNPSEPFFGSGTALVTRRDTITRLGPLAEPFFAYYEDGDWCWRARLAGMTVRYDPSSVVEHRHSATSGGANPFVARLARRNRAMTLIRNAPWQRGQAGARRALSEAGGRERIELVPKLAWAARSRRELSLDWALTPGEVWDRWVNVGSQWDRGPVRAP